MALPPRTDKQLPSGADEYVSGDPPSGIRIGIALSGGGIRSAAFNLGALQALQSRGVLEQASYLAAVSGGNYIASGLTISGAYSDPRFDNGVPLWGRRSPEERYLRQNTSYLVPGWRGRIWLGLSVAYGFILNYLPFVLSAFIAGRLIGWPLHAFGLELADLRFNGLALPRSAALTALLLGAVAAIVLALLLVAFRRFRDGRERPANYGDTMSERNAAALVFCAGAIGILLILPVLAGLYRTGSTFMLSLLTGDGVRAFGRTAERLTVGALWILLLLGVAVTALALSRRLRARRLMVVLSSLASAGLLLAPLLSSLDHSTQHGVNGGRDIVLLGVAVLIVLGMAILVHNRRYSMHLFYRERLNSAFALRRTENPETHRVVAEPISFTEPLYFADIGAKLGENNRRLPDLIVCCAVNVTSDEVPVGRYAESFTFQHDRTGGPLFGYLPTRQYEERRGVSGTRLTLPSIMAVSGAALSPLMGRFTYPPMRFLMALTNVRLGVWIKNPRHRSWCAGESEPPRRGRLARIAKFVKDGWYEPGALYVLREALGGAKSTHRFIYLTDGGHWENLGLVELLRRRCTHVLCFDASADRTGTGLDIGRAIALARTELGANITLDPRPVMPMADGLSADTAVTGRIRYPDQDEEARLVYAKAVLTADSSWDLHAFKARDARFPHHSTSQQVFSDEQFEAYRSLGFQAGCRALDRLNIPDPLLDTPEPQDIGHVPDDVSDDERELAGRGPQRAADLRYATVPRPGQWAE